MRVTVEVRVHPAGSQSNWWDCWRTAGTVSPRGCKNDAEFSRKIKALAESVGGVGCEYWSH